MVLGMLSGCSLFSPFADPRQPRPGLLRDAHGIPIKNENGDVQPTHVSVAQAREYARALQDAYRLEIRDQSALRQINNSVLIGLASSAIGVAATGGASSAIAALGISGAGVGALGSQLVIAVRRQIYTQGGAALECIIGAASRAPEPVANTQAMEAVGTLLTSLGTVERAYLDALNELSACNDQRENTTAAEDLRTIHRSLQAYERYAAQLQRTLEAMDNRGQILLSAVESVRWRVDDELVKAEPDLLAFDNALRQSLENASASYRSGAQPAPAAPSVDAVPRDARARFKVCTTLGAKLDTALDLGQRLVNDVEAAKTSMASAQAVSVYDPTLFTNCSLANPIGLGPLRAEPAEAEVLSGASATLQTLVRGGRAPYSFDAGVLAKGVTVQAGPAMSGEQIYTISMTSDAAPKGAAIIVVFRDSAGAAATFLVRAQATAASPVTPLAASPAAPPAAPQAAAPASDARVKKVQEELIAQQKLSGSADGVWSAATRTAIIALLQEQASSGTGGPDPNAMSQLELIKAAEMCFGIGI